MVSVNGYDESRYLIERFVKRENLSQIQLLAGRQVARNQYSVRGYPTSFLIDRRGRVVDRLGFIDFDALKKQVNRLLQERS